MGGTSGGPSKSWNQWWTEENSYVKKMTLSSKMFYVVKATLFVLIANGIRTSDLFRANLTLNKPLINVGGLVIAIAILFAIRGVFQSTEGNLPYAARQTIGIIIFLSINVGLFILFLEDSDAIRYALAGYYFVGAFCQLGLLFGVKIVKNFYFVHDLVCGHIIFIPIFVMAGLQLPHHIQTWLLYHNALSTDVVVSDILRYAQKSQKAGGEKEKRDEELVEQVSELRKLVQKQEQMMMNAGLLKDDKSAVSRNESTDAFAELVSPDTEDDVQIHQPAQSSMFGGGARAMSMTGLDVWGPMTIGDGNQDDARRGLMDSYQNVEYNSSQTRPKSGAFTFSQPDQMPPR
jgi:callose synthase